MIDINSERLLTIQEACFRVPSRGRRGGVDYRTVWAWMNRGLRGVKLERVRAGGRVFTSEEALQRFMQRLSDNDDGGATGKVVAGSDGAAAAGEPCPSNSRPLPITPAQERRRQEAAERELIERFGLKPRREE